MGAIIFIVIIGCLVSGLAVGSICYIIYKKLFKNR